MATDIVLKDRNGQDVTYKGIETVTFDTPDEDVQATFTHGKVVEDVTIEPDFSEGDQVITVPDGSLVKEATIVKPAALVPENIRAGTNVAGVVGELIGDTEEVTVDLNFPSGSVETDILPLTQYSDFAPDSDFGTNYYTAWEQPSSYILTAGETYMVYWDEKPYECRAIDVSSMMGMEDTVALGNGAIAELDGNNEPFVIIAINSISGVTYMSLTDTEAGNEHTVRIYQVAKGAAVDMVVTPSAETKVMSKVTVIKPETMLPENIRAGIDIGGVVGEYVTPGTTKEIEPDFSEGDHAVTAGEDELWNEVVVKMPENLVPENIAKDVVIAGVVGTKEGGSPLCTFSYFVSGTNKPTSAQMQSVKVPLSVSVPLSSDIIMVVTGSADLKGTSTAMPSNYPLISSMTVNTSYTETENTNAKTVSYTYTAFTSAYTMCVACMVVFFAIPGITLKTEGDKLIFHCDQSVTTLPNGVYGAARMQDKNNITEIDLSESTITDIPNYVFYGMTKVEKVTFPSTLKSIGTSVFYNCSALKTVDCTRCTSVPTLGNTSVFEKNTGLQILVPAALYDTWKAATNWSTYASYIVAV